jgi:hypothetical protein
MDTDPIPRAYYPEAPVETTNANTEELRKAEKALEFLPGVLAWFDDCIANTDSNRVVRETATTKKVSYEVSSLAYDLVREVLEEKRAEFMSLQQTFSK